MTDGLKYRIEKSIALLRKAEKIAKMYDPENGFFLAFSGGKDSQALYHIAKLAGVAFKAHFNPTSVDPPQVIRFIRRQYPDVEFAKLTKSMYTRAIEKKCPPTRRVRWCCDEYKEATGAGKVTLIGIRHAESINRSKRNEVALSSRKFDGDWSEFEDWRDELNDGKETEVHCIKGKDSLLVSPIIEWTDRDVWEFLNDVVKVPHCELYDPPYNQHRIGCVLCPMASRKQHLIEERMFPHVKKKWIETFQTLIDNGNYVFWGGQFREHGRTLTGEDVYDWWQSGVGEKEWLDRYLNTPKLFEDEEL